MEKKLTLKRSVVNGQEYWQAGYHEKGKWFLELQLGTADKLVRELKAARSATH